MRRKILIISGVAGFFALLWAAAASAGYAPEDDVISRELDIIERQMNTPAVMPGARAALYPGEASRERYEQPSGPAYYPPAIPQPEAETGPIARTGPEPLDQPDPYPVYDSPIKDEEIFPEDMALLDGAVDITGEVRTGFGFESEEFHWQRANYDLNEKSFRLLTDQNFAKKENTYDPAIFSRLAFNVDAAPEASPFSFHTNISIDPWSYTGKTRKTIVSGGAAAEGTGIINNPDVDSAEIQLLYWGNTGYTVNQTYRTLEQGDGFALPELKVVDGYTQPIRVNSTFGSLENHFDKFFDIPALKVETQFQPVREFWMDFTPDESFGVRVFPMAYSDQALTSDDPLRLSNNKMFWEPSPWLNSWKSGHFNSDAAANDFFQGYWDNSLTFLTRDSDGRHLTALRGFSIGYAGEDTTFNTVLATPKTLWQNYDTVSAAPASARLKHFLDESFYVGGITNVHYGFTDEGSTDSTNFVYGLDSGYMPTESVKIEGQVSTSRSKQDITNTTYETEQRGNAYYISVTSSSVMDAEMLKKDYFNLARQTDEETYYKNMFYWGQMDSGFESSLSNYHNTRDDSYWARHINFRPPLDLFFTEGKGRMGIEGLQPFANGNGLDYGRSAFGLNNEFAFWGGDLINRNHARNVHSTDDEYIETVVRTELEHKTTEKLTTKVMFLRHDLPETTENLDPWIADADGDFVVNDNIIAGKDPSVNTASAGLKYAFNDAWTWNGVYEYTNDFTGGSDNFPRGILNSSSFTTFGLNGLTYRTDIPFLYSQGFFDLPPYEYHNVFKTGIGFKPDNKFSVYLDYTRNPNEFAGQIDNHINHVGLEVAYRPVSKFGMMVKYTWSRAKDPFNIIHGDINTYSHHNVYTELRYKFDPLSNLVLQYGVGTVPNVSSDSFDPFGGSLPVLDTQHIVRLSYQKFF